MFRPRTLALGLALTATAAAPAAAFARHGADDPAGDDRGGLREGGDDSGSGGGDRGRGLVRATGRCTGAATAKLKAKPDDGRLEVEFEVDQNRTGVPWRVAIRRDGRTVVLTRAVTRAPSGSFSVERRIADGAGTDRITARAVSPGGQVCTASLSI